VGRKIEVAPGTVFGKWTVLGEARNNKGVPGYLCRCECGREQFHRYTRLKSVKSCPDCVDWPDRSKPIAVGRQFSKWTVLKEVDRDPKGNRLRYLCICECGVEKIVHAHKLLNGGSTQCKTCQSKTHSQIMSHHLGVGEVPGPYLTRLIAGANRKRTINVYLSIEDLENQWQVQNKRCALTGWALSLQRSDRDSSATASVDRIDSSEGYTPDNIQWVHKDINRLKNNYTEERFFEMCQAVVNYKDQTKKLREGRRPWLRNEEI
jgi:hypothetical protein